MDAHTVASTSNLFDYDVIEGGGFLGLGGTVIGHVSIVDGVYTGLLAGVRLGEVFVGDFETKAAAVAAVIAAKANAQ